MPELLNDIQQWLALHSLGVFVALVLLLFSLVLILIRWRRATKRLQNITQKNKHLDASLESMALSRQRDIESHQRKIESHEQQINQYQQQLEQQTEYKNNLEGQVEALKQVQTQLKQVIDEHAQLKMQYGQLKAQEALQKEFHQERLEQARKSQDQLQNTFEQLSSKVFKAQQQDFSQVAQAQLQPIKQQMEKFKGKMEELNRYDTKERAKLFAELEHLKNSNQKISEEAVNLTNALTSSSKRRGLWGEAILERVLEASGLRKGEEYQTQVSFERQGKRYIPDVVVNLPDSKQVIIDSKAVMLDYERYTNANESEKPVFLKKYTDQVKLQVKSLAEKKYHKINDQTAELVLLFIPIEGAFQTLLENNATVFHDAMRQSVIITGPSTLMATLRIIHLLWQNERQQKNALEIAELAGKLYDQMALMMSSFNDVGDKLRKAQDAYNKTLDQLSEGRGNVLKKAEQLKTLGAKHKKTIELIQPAKHD